MLSHTQCTFNREFLKNATILYIEDEEIIRTEVADIFSGFFKEVYVARDGEEGLEIFKNHKDKIDVILTDINMPKLDGISLLSKIREIDWEVPILISTAFKETDILLKAIKYNVQNYIIKPMQLNTTLKIISQIIENIENKKELAKTEYELKQFMMILDTKNIICEFDLHFNITHVNDSYLLLSGYNLEELIGKPFSFTKDNESFEKNIKDIKDTLYSKQVWEGDFKSISKNDIPYYTNSMIMPIFSKNGNLQKFVEFSTLTTKYEKEILSLKKLIMSVKTESTKSKKELQSKDSKYEFVTNKLKQQLDDSATHAQELLVENFELKKMNDHLVDKLKDMENKMNVYYKALSNKHKNEK